jgi:uncharacterized membrane protein YuzA (DUF378 family)
VALVWPPCVVGPVPLRASHAPLAWRLLWQPENWAAPAYEKGNDMANYDSNAGSGMNTLLKIAMALAIIGAVNWGLIGFLNWNLVDAIFGGGAREETSTISRVIYALVGLAGLLSLRALMSSRAPAHHGIDAVPHSR